MYYPKAQGTSLSFSLGRRPEKRESQAGAFRQLAPPFSHFGYDDFGRSMGFDVVGKSRHSIGPE
jgi:hypothetical protein